MEWKEWNWWFVQLTVGSWLFMGQVAIANEVLPEKTNATEETSEVDGANSPATTVDKQLKQIAQAERVEITDIQLQETSTGFALQLKTDGELVVPETAVTGNAAIADISNAELNLPEGEEFSASNPADGIALVQVTSLQNNRVRIAITGFNAPPEVNISTGTTGLTIRATAGEPTAQNPEPIELVVEAQRGDDYFVPNSSTATRTDTPILETPVSIQVIPEEIIEEQQATDLEDALDNTSGASVDSTEGRGFQINLRGFNNAPVFRDGFRLYAPSGQGDAAAQGFPEMANVERIEVLKGPASILFGQIQPGGAVNVITKKPLEDPFYEVKVQGGSFFARPQIDISGPITEDESLLYRLNAVYQNENSFRDYDQEIERIFVSPSITWQIGNSTDINFQLKYENDERPLDPGLVALGDGVADIPRDRILGEPDDRISSEFFSVGYDLEHQFSDDWKLRNNFRYLRKEDDINATLSFPFIGGLDESTGTLNRVFAKQDFSNETLGLQTNIVGEFATGSIDHTLLVGIDLSRYLKESASFTKFRGAPSFRTPINIFDPVYGQVPEPEFPEEPTSSDEVETDSLKLYLQDQIKLSDSLTLVAGANYETTSQTVTSMRGGEKERNEDAFNPRVGVVYQPADNVSLYSSYSQSFLPSTETTAEGELLEPEEGEGFEVGVKTELLDRRLLATLAYFNITKENVATDDPNNPRSSIATGERRSQGIELDVNGEIAPGWNVTASYAYTDAEITEDDSIDVGNRLPGVPQHSANLWTTYEIQSGDLAGLGFGLGVNWASDREGDLENSFELDSYFLTNAAIFYKQENLEYRLNFENIFDVNYIQGTPRTRTRGIEPGDPFTVKASVRYRF